MVIARHHVLGAKVQEGDQVHPPDFLNITRVAFGDVMGGGLRRHRQQGEDNRQHTPST